MIAAQLDRTKDVNEMYKRLLASCAARQVVTGVGKHSLGGVPRILPAVVRYLTDAGYRFREEPNNPGVICVMLPGKRNALLRKSAIGSVDSESF